MTRYYRFYAFEDYHLQHTPTEPDDDWVTLDKLYMSEIAPSDLFEHPTYYLNASGVSKSDLLKFMSYVKSIQGDADALVTMYRGAPSGGKLNRGDWVTPFKSYADVYANGGGYSDNANSRVYKYVVKASELTCDFDSLAEWGYFGDTIIGEEV